MCHRVFNEYETPIKNGLIIIKLDLVRDENEISRVTWAVYLDMGLQGLALMVIRREFDA